MLQLAPAALVNGYKQPNVSSWGGSVLKGEDGRWHMFVEEIVNNVSTSQPDGRACPVRSRCTCPAANDQAGCAQCGLNTYARNMRIAHAVSTTSSAAGPYLPKNLVTEHSASTPHAARDPATGDWLVFATGCGRAACLAVGPCAGGVTPAGSDMSPCPEGPQPAAEPEVASGHAAPCSCPLPGFAVPGPECSVDWGTNVFRAPNADGPWNLTAPLLDVGTPALPPHADGTPVVMANPSAVLLKNGTVGLMYRDFLQKLQFPATNVIGLAWCVEPAQAQ